MWSVTINVLLCVAVRSRDGSWRQSALHLVLANLVQSHSVTCHPTQVNTARLNPQPEAGTQFTYPEGWKAELT